MSAPGEPDVVVVGSGAGGAACAWALACRGVDVTVLEMGRWFDPLVDYRLHRDDWEQTLFPQSSDQGLPYTFGAMATLDRRYEGLLSWNRNRGKLNGTGKRHGWRYHHVVGVGGSTLHFTGEAHRLNPRSMQMGSRYGVAADWPLTYEELEPYYALAEEVLGVAGPPADLRCPRSRPYPLPPHPPAYASRRVIDGLDALGLGWTHNSLAVLSTLYDDRPPCNYCGCCNRGCPRTDKGSADVTFARKAMATGRCRIVTDATVLRLEGGGRDRVETVVYADRDGSHHRVRPRVVVLACGAIATPRLLLLSGNGGSPDGLANESGQAGRNLMETIAWVSSGLHPDDLGSYRGLPKDIICWDYNGPDAIPDVPGGCRFGPNMAEADLIGPISYAQRVVEGWGRAHKARMREQFGRVLSVGAIGESLPNEDSYVDIDHGAHDRNGMPVARIHSRVGETDARRLQFMATKCREILAAAGVDHLIEEYGSYDFFSATHVFGTARMGADPMSSVVDRNCRSHRWRNLYIADASVFPSSGGGESPSLTIEALAIRTADEIRGCLGRGEV